MGIFATIISSKFFLTLMRGYLSLFTDSRSYPVNLPKVGFYNTKISKFFSLPRISFFPFGIHFNGFDKDDEQPEKNKRNCLYISDVNKFNDEVFFSVNGKQLSQDKKSGYLGKRLVYAGVRNKKTKKELDVTVLFQKRKIPSGIRILYLMYLIEDIYPTSLIYKVYGMKSDYDDLELKLFYQNSSHDGKKFELKEKILNKANLF